MGKRCPFARRVVVYSTQFASNFVTRWYCERAETWCPFRGRRRECPHLPPASTFYKSIR
ncbi:MAG: hypothetical protein QW407_05335 [Thermofilaceae archaeon]